MSSSLRPAVPQVFSAPTVSATGELPGDVMPPSTGAPVGALARVARRRDDHDAGVDARATAWHSGSVSARLDHRMAERQVDDLECCICARLSIAQSMPAMTSLVRPLPSAPSTRTLTRFAPGAMPPL